MKKILLYLIILFFLLGYGVYKFVVAQSSEKISVIMVSFGSKTTDGDWQGEVAPYIEELENAKDVSESVPMCEKAFRGYIYDQPVMLVISGIAKVKATACTLEVLNLVCKDVEEVIFSGIAGITPMKGGMLDTKGNLRYDEAAMIGDVCINSAAFDFDLQRFSSDQYDSFVPMPSFWSSDMPHESDYVYAKPDLTNELYEASLLVNWPEPSEEAREMNFRYHQKSRIPKSWKSTECLEATDDLFWHDIRADARARVIGSSWLSKSYGLNLSAEDIIVVTSMESLPVGLTVSWWNESNNKDIDFAYVRGASNFDHPRLNSDGTPALGGRESLEGSESGYSFAIRTQALPVLKMLELRSM